MSNSLFEILVPVKDNNGFKFNQNHHLEFDEFVISLSGGLTILKPTKGKWLYKHADSQEKLYEDEMIPVRIACNQEDIIKIANFALEHYGQIAMMVYKISDEVMIIGK